MSLAKICLCRLPWTDCVNLYKPNLYQPLLCSFCDERVHSLCLDHSSEPCRLPRNNNRLSVFNILRGRMKNSWVVMPLLSPQKVKARGRLQTTTGDSSERFGSRLSKLLGYVQHLVYFDDNWLQRPSMRIIYASSLFLHSAFIELIRNRSS